MAKYGEYYFNPLNVNFTKWSNTLKQFGGNLPTNCLSVFDHFVWLALKGLKEVAKIVIVVFKSCCHMVTIWRSFSAVTNAVVAVNDCWQAIILSADVDEIESKTAHKDKEGDC